MEAGICYIKKEFLIEEPKAANGDNLEARVANNNKRKILEDGDEKDDASQDQNDSSNYNKSRKNNKQERKRGQNKNRPVYKEDRTLHLCHSLVNGPTEEKCTYPNCRYVHDLAEYLAAKGEDLGAVCPVYAGKGFCPRGVTCRFAKAHLDDEGKNIKSANYDENAPASTVNGISSEMQVRLRKRDIDFTRSKDLLTRFEKLREERKQKKEEDTSVNKVNAEEPMELSCEATEKVVEPVDKAEQTLLTSPHSLTEKPIGTAFEDDATARSKPPIDFREKLMLSPLTTVGNLPFRRICKEFGADITCGEMACAVPLIKGLTQEWALTKRHSSEDIFGVQLCGNNPNILSQTAQLLQETAKVDFIDLNIGCPIDLIYQQGGGSALMRRTNILELTVRTCAALSERVPFTVKMRTGVYADKSVAHDLVPLVEEWGAAAVTLHGRSREQRYTRSANWAYIEECAAKARHMPIIGNGDILSYEDYNERRKLAPHVSSVMIGRGALIKPWLFQEIKQQQNWQPTASERYAIMQKYVNYGLEHWGSDTKGVETTRRFLLEWQSFLYRYIPYDLLEQPPQRINQRPQKYRGRDEMETLMASPNAADWVRLSEMLLGPVPQGFNFVPKHKANSY